MEEPTACPGGVLMAGFMNPATYLFDGRKAEQGRFEVRHALPFDPRTLSAEELAYEFDPDQPLEFSHSLEDQIGAQLDAGLRLTALFEDTVDTPLGQRMPTFIATRAEKPLI